ncbi:DinB family protein [Winogradskyella tangerina]|uniref:DinB family protein n=1 Tax=Winogradskyella tangerina TaxID=2023240 RepID=UPI000DBE40A2|nr:DinB family protein [Winogradskyella tangerina]
MDKEAIAELIDEKHTQLIDWLRQQSEESWTEGPVGKWTTGQHALHLLQSIKPLNFALSMPKFFLKYKFGKANRPVRAYDAIVKRYEERLEQAQGATFRGSQNMKIPPVSEKNYILNRLQTESKKLQFKTKKMSDKHLDNLILPHPLMGKMPIREIIMWTAHHVEHHSETLKTKY